MNYPFLSQTQELNGGKVILRADLDVDIQIGEMVPSELLRINVLKPTIDFLKEKKVKRIVIIAHRGRPTPETKESLSLQVILPILEKVLQEKINFLKSLEEVVGEEGIYLLENLRFNEGEEKNDTEYAKQISFLGDIYINESFATSHRSHASIIALPKIVREMGGRAYLGLRFEEEVKNLSRIFNNPERPLVAVVSGVKEDKIKYAEELTKTADKVLVGGKIPVILDTDKSVRLYSEEDKLIIGNVIIDKQDITLHTIDVFKSEIAKAKTILLAGVLGRYEDEGHRQGTKEIFEAIANSNAYKVVGGGDSLMAIDMLHLENKFDWISVGGGAMLEFITSKTLSGLEALNSI